MQATLKGRMDDRSGGGGTVWPARGRVQRHSLLKPKENELVYRTKEYQQKKGERAGKRAC